MYIHTAMLQINIFCIAVAHSVHVSIHAKKFHGKARQARTLGSNSFNIVSSHQQGIHITCLPHHLALYAQVYTLPFPSSGRVMSVSVALFNSTAVNVSWTPLPSVDVTSYTVYYSQLVK